MLDSRKPKVEIPDGLRDMGVAGKNSISLAWGDCMGAPPPSNVKCYHLRWEKSGGGNGYSHVRIPRAVEAYSVEDLEAETEYEFLLTTEFHDGRTKEERIKASTVGEVYHRTP